MGVWSYWQLQRLALKTVSASISWGYHCSHVHYIRASWDQVRHKSNRHALCGDHWWSILPRPGPSRTSLLSTRSVMHCKYQACFSPEAVTLLEGSTRGCQYSVFWLVPLELEHKSCISWWDSPLIKSLSQSVSDYTISALRHVRLWVECLGNQSYDVN